MGTLPSEIAKETDVARRRRKALKVDVRDVRRIRAELGGDIEASREYMAPIVQQHENNMPLEISEVRRAGQEMGEMAAEDLRLADANLTKVLRRNEKRKTTGRARPMPVEMANRIKWACQDVRQARKTFSIDKEYVQYLLVEGYKKSTAEETITWDAEDFLVEAYLAGMYQLRSAWLQLFYATQFGFDVVQDKLSADATKKFMDLERRGYQKNHFTDKADKKAAEMGLPVLVVSDKGLLLYSVYPQSITSLRARSATKTPGKLRQEWHHLRQAAGFVTTLKGRNVADITATERERISEILKTEGPTPVRNLLSRVAVEGYLGRELSLKEWQETQFLRPMVEDFIGVELNDSQFERAVVFIKKGPSFKSPADMATKLGVQAETVHSLPAIYQTEEEERKRLERHPPSAGFLSNPSDEMAEHDAMMSLTFF